MDRVVKHLYGKLYMGPMRTPHYYVRYNDSENLEFVRCSDVSISNAQKIAFDVNFDKDERRAGCSSTAARETNTKKPGPSKPLSALNFIAGESDERATGDRIALQKKKNLGGAQWTDGDAYESSFIHDSTPTISSSTDSDEPCSSKSVVKTTKARKRVVFDSDDELSSKASPSKPSSSKQRKPASSKQAALVTIGAESTAPRSTRASKYTPLVIIGATSHAAKDRSNASSPDIPVITLSE
ncbi:hypothetical protein AAVH_18050 [Aphelenchoides avenae]|nr:hypothetical protein AAVH_18050 [Aphelenchus avenae]